ncbi:acyl-CoA dehydrogenase [Janthinobacterium sp. FT14W]|nr:acyl-CoA dehydrogenase [Janthinobacterium sp. FT14W]
MDGLRRLCDAGLDQLPLPGHGATLRRWQMLAAIAAIDLSLLKLYESHTDALAILAEIGGPGVPAGSSWGVWCAEMPDARVKLQQTADGRHVLDGHKASCAGAHGLSHALISCWNKEGQACLACVALAQPGVHVSNEGWQAVGMQACASVDVTFSRARAVPVGAPGAYLARPGYWHGSAGIAAAWYGAACAVASHLHARAQHAAPDPVRLAQLGQIDCALRAAGALLREGAAEIDAQPQRNAMELALRLRLAVEDAATLVLHLATRALGAGPLCRDARFARLAADLPVFLRQSHAERDQAVLGGIVAGAEAHPWAL